MQNKIMKIREINQNDREVFTRLCDEFYHSDGVLHPVDPGNYTATFNELISNSPYTNCFIFEEDDEVAGYGLISFSFSNEVGGLVLWVEELFILPQFRGNGIGSKFFSFLHDKFDDRVKRYRLEIEPSNDGAKRLYKRLGFNTLPYKQMINDM